MAQQTALSVTATPGPVHTFAPKSPVVILLYGICEILVDAHHPALDLEGDWVPWLVDAGDPLPLDMTSSPLDVSAANEDLILICPY